MGHKQAFVWIRDVYQHKESTKIYIWWDAAGEKDNSSTLIKSQRTSLDRQRSAFHRIITLTNLPLWDKQDNIQPITAEWKDRIRKQQKVADGLLTVYTAAQHESHPVTSV